MWVTPGVLTEYMAEVMDAVCLVEGPVTLNAP